MKFIHIADVHLGAEPDVLSSYSRKRGAEIWNSFAHVIEVCGQTQADLLLIAGDLFHRQPLRRELREVDFLFSGLSHTQVVIIAGNHDHIKKNSCYLTFQWSPNVHFLDSPDLMKIEIPGIQTAVYGLSYHSKENSLPVYDTAWPDGSQTYQILLGHGGDACHIPFQKQSLLKLGYDYIALGHIHKPQDIVKGRIAYAGALEPIDKNDTGMHGYIVGTITEAGLSTEFVASAVREYIHMEIEVQKEMTGFELRQKIKEMLEAAGSHHIYKLILKGFCNPDTVYDLSDVESYGNIVEIEDQTRPVYDFDKLLNQNRDNLIGKYIESFRGCDTDSEEYQALCEGISALLETKKGQE